MLLNVADLLREVSMSHMSVVGHALKSTTAASNHARSNPAPKLTLDQRVALS
jgi:hypothetical protein